MPDWLSEKNYYAVEHYKPKSKFPNLETEYINLFYSCGTCNGRKGTFWPDKKQKEEDTFIPNPCDHVMHKHLRSQPDGKVKAYTFAGEWTKEILDLNEAIWVEKRRFFISQKELLVRARIKIVEVIQALDVKKGSADPAELKELNSEISINQKKLDETDRNINYL